MSLCLYNTATRTTEDFSPLLPPWVTMYNCGPTVYNYAHIGNLRAYVFADVLRRTLRANGYNVKQVINITDVGHLTSDGDEGEDKMTLGALREGKSIEAIITEYTDAFYADLKALNILAAEDKGKEESFPRATHHIPEQKALIETLNTKGYTYITSDGIYFDTSKFPRYADFAKLDVAGMQAGNRVAMGEKKNPTDFALWKFSHATGSTSSGQAPADAQQREQEWDSPLGIAHKGFPGWHLECSAMAMKYLGETIDIHTGGIDHIPVHHSNEIAQSECATGKPFARYWMHSAFMTVDGQKMSKSIGNTYRLTDLHEHNISPLAFRYWLLTAHYRTQVNFTWEALKGAQVAVMRLLNVFCNLTEEDTKQPDQPFMDTFMGFLNDDINTPKAIALIADILQDFPHNIETSEQTKYDTLCAIDRILGLNLLGIKTQLRTHESSDLSADEKALIEKLRGISEDDIPEHVRTLRDARATAREEKNFAESDRLRDEIKKLGYNVKDTPGGQQLERIS